MPPVSPRLRRPPEGAGVARGVPRHGHFAAAAVGRGLPGGRCVGRGRVCGACARPPPPWGRVGTPRAPVGCPSLPLAGGRWMPCCVKPFPTPSGLLFFCLTWPARGNSPAAPSSQLPPPGRGGAGGGGGRMCRARGGSPAGTKHLKNLVRLLAVDHSARASMKNAASCEN